MADASTIGLDVSIDASDNAGLPQFLTVKNNSGHSLQLDRLTSPQLLDIQQRQTVMTWDMPQVAGGSVTLSPGESTRVRILGAPYSDCDGHRIEGGIRTVYFPVIVRDLETDVETSYAGATDELDPTKYGA